MPGWKSPDPKRLSVLLLLLTLAAFGAWADDLPTLLEHLERRFVVYTLSDGYALLPREDHQADLLEVRGGSVAIAGKVLDREALRERVAAEDRVAVEALAAFTASPEALRALRRLPERPAPAAQQDTLLPPPEVEEQPAPPAKVEGRPAVPQGVEAPRPSRERRPPRQSRRQGQRLRFFRTVHVDQSESVREATSILGDVVVRGVVRGDVVAIGGSVRVEGSIGGSATAVGGSIMLEKGAEIDGDAVAIGGEVRRARGAVVRGDINEIGIFGPFRLEGDWRPDGFFDLPISRWRFRGPGLLERLLDTGLLIVFTLALMLIARGPMSRLTSRVRATPLRAAGVGLAIQVAALPLFAIVSVVLFVSIIGIPLLLLMPIALLALVIVAAIGYAGAVAAVGKLVAARFGRDDDGPLVIAVLGVVAIQFLSLVGEVIDGWFFPFYLIGLVLLILGFATRYAALTIGLGAVVLSAAGRRSAPSLPPPPPPIIERERGDDPLSGWRS